MAMVRSTSEVPISDQEDVRVGGIGLVAAHESAPLVLELYADFQDA